jgi:hypothetical protein
MDLSDYPLSLIFTASLLAIFVATEIGRRVGLLAARQKQENISTIEGAILGLLALLIAFTFSIPSMLTVDAETRQKAVGLIKQALSARGELSTEDRERLRRVSELFGVEEGSSTVRNRPVLVQKVQKEIHTKAS